MTFPRFSQLWDALVTNRQTQSTATMTPAQPLSNGMGQRASEALIALVNGDRTAIDRARQALSQEA